MQKKQGLGLTVRKENLQKWYPEVVIKSDMADYSAVKGCMIIKPNAYFVWQEIQNFFNQRLLDLKVRNAYFPLFIPESFFTKEQEHARGFKPEVAWIANSENSERLAIRPTSETIIYDSYSKWIRTYKDLPIRLNQWSNVVRFETKATRLFLRTREFLWQEGHCAYASKEECEKETSMFLNEYEKICNELLALPVIKGYKSQKEKFAGAIYTLTIESIMPDGKSLQCGTSHNLGQGFAKSFKIEYLGNDENKHFPYQNSWGISTRLIGATIMVHGDDKGLIIPPRISFNKLVIIPILFQDSKEAVIKLARKIFRILTKFNPILDEDESYSPGWKFHEYELKGIPIRIEIGPKELRNKSVILVRRDLNSKTRISIKKLPGEIKLTLKKMQSDILDKAKKLQESKILFVKNYKEMEDAIKKKKIARGNWCKSDMCENTFYNRSKGIKIILIEFEKAKIPGPCVICGLKSRDTAYFGKTY